MALSLICFFQNAPLFILQRGILRSEWGYFCLKVKKAKENCKK